MGYLSTQSDSESPNRLLGERGCRENRQSVGVKGASKPSLHRPTATGGFLGAAYVSQLCQLMEQSKQTPDVFSRHTVNIILKDSHKHHKPGLEVSRVNQTVYCTNSLEVADGIGTQQETDSQDGRALTFGKVPFFTEDPWGSS
eukprot:s252_g10.t1